MLDFGILHILQPHPHHLNMPFYPLLTLPLRYSSLYHSVMQASHHTPPHDYPSLSHHRRAILFSVTPPTRSFPFPSRPESALALEVRRLLHVWEEMPYPRCFQHLGGMTENKDNARQWHDVNVCIPTGRNLSPKDSLKLQKKKTV